jgi:hypothetical protein
MTEANIDYWRLVLNITEFMQKFSGRPHAAQMGIRAIEGATKWHMKLLEVCGEESL